MKLFSGKGKDGKQKPQKKKKAIRGKVLLGIDVGSKVTRVLVGTCKVNKIEVEQYVNGKNKSDIAANGKIINTEQAEANLKGLIKFSGSLIKDAVSTVESTEIIKRELIIPDVPESDILGLVTYEMGQYLPIDTSSYLIQYKKADSFVENGVTKVKVIVGAMPRSIIGVYAQVFAGAGITPYSLDTNSNSIEKLLKFDVENNPESPFKSRNVAFIDMGHSYFNISLFGDTNFLFSKLIEIGGSMIDSLISKQLNIGSTEAENFKLELSSRVSIIDLARKFVDREAAMQSVTGNQKILLGFLEVIDKWLYEIDSVLKYYTTRNRKNAIDEIYLYGGCSYYKDIEKYFEYKLNIKTSRITNLGCVQCKDQRIEGELPNFLNLLGALILN